MSNLFEDHAAPFLALLASTGLTVYDGEVPDGAPDQYVVAYPYFETPDGLLAPDALSLTLASTVLDIRIYVHNIGSTAQSARATAARSRVAVLDQVLTVSGWTCFPIRWKESQPAGRDEDIPGKPVFDVVDVYGWRALPA